MAATGSSDAAPAVDASLLCRRYGRRWALVDVSLSVPRGQVVIVTGRNGSGKSTLLRLLATALRPDRGGARVAGCDIVTERDEARRRVALLAHQSHLYEALTALENLEATARCLGRTRADLLARLEEVGLAERAHDAVATFSAGMRKRLSLARLLLKDDARVVLLDEPYAALDPPGFQLVDRVVERLKAGGATVLVATHLVERGALHAERGIVLEAGRLVWEGPAADTPVFRQEEP